MSKIGDNEKYMELKPAHGFPTHMFWMMFDHSKWLQGYQGIVIGFYKGIQGQGYKDIQGYFGVRAICGYCHIIKIPASWQARIEVAVPLRAVTSTSENRFPLIFVC